MSRIAPKREVCFKKPKKEKKSPKYLKRSFKPIKPGKKQKAWTNTRRYLKEIFFDKGITTCQLRYEGCWINDGLGFAHATRRRFIPLSNKERLECVILACQNCHTKLDRHPHSETERIVKEIRAESGL